MLCLRASIDIGAILAGGSTEQREILADYAGNIGLAFQVVDDLLDLTADAESLGKTSGKRCRSRQIDLPWLAGGRGGPKEGKSAD